MGNKLILGVLALIAVVGLFLPTGNDSKTIVERVSNNLGAVNSPDLNIGGMRLVAAKTTALNQATSSVLCTLQSPAATSTFLHGSFELTSATGTATSISISRGTAMYSVGSLVLATTSVTSGQQATLIATTTAVFAPNTYAVFMQTGSGEGLLNPTGSCQALWQVTN